MAGDVGLGWIHQGSGFSRDPGAASLGATGGFSDINTVANAATSVESRTVADRAAGLIDGFIQTQNDGKIVVASTRGGGQGRAVQQLDRRADD